MIDKKRYSLILNKSYQPLSVEGVKKSLGYLVGDEGKAMDSATYELFTFDKWIKRFDEQDLNSTMRSEKLWIMIPEIIVLNTNSKKKKKTMYRGVSKKKVFERDGHRCGYCNDFLTGINKTIDHIIPTSRGGAKNDYKNVVACCGPCNSKKGDRLLSEIGWEIKHKLYSPETDILYHVPKHKRMESWNTFIK